MDKEKSQIGVSKQMVYDREKAREEFHDLLRKIGVPIKFQNGERYYGPPRDHSGLAPPKWTEIYIGKLPQDTFESELVGLFERIGKIYKIRIPLNFQGNRGFSYIQYYRPEHALDAIWFLNDYEIRQGRRIGVALSMNDCRLYIKGIPREMTKEDVFEEIKRKTQNVSALISYFPTGFNRKKNRGLALVDYENHEAAEMAHSVMKIDCNRMWRGVCVTVDWTYPTRKRFGYLPFGSSTNSDVSGSYALVRGNPTPDSLRWENIPYRAGKHTVSSAPIAITETATEDVEEYYYDSVLDHVNYNSLLPTQGIPYTPFEYMNGGFFTYTYKK